MCLCSFVTYESLQPVFNIANESKAQIIILISVGRHSPSVYLTQIDNLYLYSITKLSSQKISCQRFSYLELDLPI